MIHGALEFYLNNKAQYHKFKFKNERSCKKSKLAKMPTWLNISKMRSTSFENNLQYQAKTLLEEYQNKKANWDKIIKGKKELLEHKQPMMRGTKKVNSDSGSAYVQPKIIRLDFKGEKNEQLKIIYASRTHSQIREFICEFKKVCRLNQLDIKLIHLGSRKLMCANPKLKKKVKSEYLGELCRLQRQRKKCELYQFHKIFNIGPEAMVMVL